MSGVSASPPTLCTFKSRIQTTSCFGYPSISVIPCFPHDHTLSSSALKLKAIRIAGGGGVGLQRTRVLCNSSTRPGGPSSGEDDSRSVLDAFFLGKALAEALNERIESTVGELLGAIGMLQNEQRRQVQDFQEEVLRRAKRAKEKAACEAMEAQGLVPPKSFTVKTSAVADDVASTTSSSATDASTPENSHSLSNPTTPTADTDPDPANNDPIVGVSNDA